MKVNKLRNKENQIINGPLEIKPKIFNDDRGYFYDSYNKETFLKLGLELNLSKEIIQNNHLFMIENQDITIQMYNSNPIDILLPTTVNLKVIKAEPAVKGDSVTSTNKTITCETGLEVSVPLFIEEGEIIKVDTKNSTYITRV